MIWVCLYFVKGLSKSLICMSPNFHPGHLSPGRYNKHSEPNPALSIVKEDSWKKLWLATQAHWIIKVKSQRTGEFAMRLAPSDVRRYTHKASSAWLPTHDLGKDHTKDMLNRSGCGKDQEASTLHKEQQATKKCWEWEKESSGKRTHTGYLMPNGKSWKHIYKLHYTEWAGCI